MALRYWAIRGDVVHFTAAFYSLMRIGVPFPDAVALCGH